MSVAIPIAKDTLSEDATICKFFCQNPTDDRDLQALINRAVIAAVTAFASNLDRRKRIKYKLGKYLSSATVNRTIRDRSRIVYVS